LFGLVDVYLRLLRYQFCVDPIIIHSGTPARQEQVHTHVRTENNRNKMLTGIK
jgi:hypothetical protein